MITDGDIDALDALVVILVFKAVMARSNSAASEQEFKRASQAYDAYVRTLRARVKHAQNFNLEK